MNCTKDFTLVVNSAGPNWASMSWSLDSQFNLGTGVSSRSFAGNIAEVRTQSSPAFGIAQQQVSGTLIWSGGSVNCNINLFMLIATLYNLGSVGFGGIVSIDFDDGSGPISLLYVTAGVEWVDYNVLNSSTDFPFTIPGAGTVTVTIGYISDVSAPTDMADMKVRATLTNVP